MNFLLLCKTWIWMQRIVIITREDTVGLKSLYYVTNLVEEI